MTHPAIIATAARTHWRHDRTGRAVPMAANDLPSVRPHGHLPPVVSRPFINATGGFFRPSYEDWRKAILEHLHGVDA